MSAGNETVVVDLDKLSAIVRMCRTAMLASNSTKDALIYLEEIIADKNAALGREHGIKVGSVVSPKPACNTLRAGQTAYGEAVVLSLNPFILASVDSKFKWDNVKPEQFEHRGVMYTRAVEQLQELWEITT